MTTFDSSELRTLASDLAEISTKTHAATREAFKEGAQRLTDQWRANATETAGTHGKRYPSAISWQEMLSTNLVFEVGPESSKPQGGMGPGFEYGSVNQEPHLDGNRAADKLGPVIEKMIATAAEDLF